MNQPQVRKGGILVALASAVIYSGVSVLAKFAYRYNLSPVQLLKERYLLASIILVVIVGFSNWRLLFPRNCMRLVSSWASRPCLSPDRRCSTSPPSGCCLYRPPCFCSTATPPSPACSP